MQTLLGHTSPETAYLVPDYPYGRKVRCRIRYWLERDDKRGWRFVSQTEHPTRKIWNAPKASTYSKICAAMYLDEKGHVQCDRITEYDDADRCLAFVKAHPLPVDHPARTDMLAWAVGKATVAKRLAEGHAILSIGGVPQVPDEARREEAAKELEIWREIIALTKTPKEGEEVKPKK